MLVVVMNNKATGLGWMCWGVGVHTGFSSAHHHCRERVPVVMIMHDNYEEQKGGTGFLLFYGIVYYYSYLYLVVAMAHFGAVLMPTTTAPRQTPAAVSLLPTCTTTAAAHAECGPWGWW